MALTIGTPGLARAQASDPVKPYIVFVMDISGSMTADTGFGEPSCGGQDTRFDHAKCALQNIVNGYGDMVMGLARFRKNSTGDCEDCDDGAIDCSACEGGALGGCTSTMNSPDRFELLVPIGDNTANDVGAWVDFSCGACSLNPADNPELSIPSGSSWTPIGGSMRGAKRYFQGLDPFYSTDLEPIYGAAGGDPIRNDPLRDIFVDGAQCRSYIVISLTDGEETCEPFSGTEAAAAALLTTDVDGQTYRIETKPIGFGQTPCETQIEGIAHAGGAVDVPGQCEGFYAQNEEELAVAMAQIIGEAIKFESCNGIDDDCDVLIDEDFPLLGTPCDDGGLGVCRGTGSYICRADENGVACDIDNPGQTATSESCNNLDDDCDGLIDEGACSNCSPVEICDNVDNDCDGLVDENLVRPCGTDVGECVAGEEQCVAGIWENCDAVGPQVEICDTLDNDCDGTIDTFAESCSDLVGGNPMVGICQPGTRICVLGLYGDCLGEVVPATEACDLLDNDCDGPVDEDTGGADCSSSCGVGTTECVAGVIVCAGSSTPEDEVCDNFDNDCDGLIDEGIADQGPCDEDGNLCIPGTLKCLGGSFQCVGGQPPGTEVCDCLDNDCDNEIDEGVVCPEGTSCVSCQCAFPCAPGEFPCPAGRYCSADSYCLIDLCFNVSCPDQNGEAYQCVEGQCVRACDLVVCPAGFVCRESDAVCVQDNCIGLPDVCADDQLCAGGECVDDPCADVSCPIESEYCFQGLCVGSCADVSCPANQSCVLGMCEPYPCGEPCPPDEVCNQQTSECDADPCAGVDCPEGQTCNSQSGTCETDPCLGVQCPAGQSCVAGSCFSSGQLEPDAGPAPDRHFVAPGGGGGCVLGGRPSPGPIWLVFALWVVSIRRRRRG